MFAVAFDLDIHELEDTFSIPQQKAYSDIEKALECLGYRHIQYSVYVCPEPKHSELLVVHETIDALKSFNWFSACIRQVIAFEVSRWGDVTQAVRG